MNGWLPPTGLAALAFLTWSAVAASLDEWTLRYEGGAGDMYCIGYGGGLFVAALESGPGAPTEMVLSNDGLTWSVVRPNKAGYLRRIAYGLGHFVLCGQNSIQTSPDGANWVLKTLAADVTLKDVAYGNDRFLAVGTKGTTPTLWTSTNLTDWAETQLSGVTVNGAGYGNGAYYAVGKITPSSSSQVAVVRSEDGEEWTTQALPFYFSTLYDLAYGGGYFVIAGTSVLVSMNGLSWQQTNQQMTSDTQIHYCNGSFLALAGNLRSSADGRSWVIHSTSFNRGATPMTLYARDIAYAQGRYVMVGMVSGWGPYIIESGDGGPGGDAAALRLGLFPGVSITGEVGRTYEIQGSPELGADAVWTALGTITLTTSPSLWYDDQPVEGVYSKYYRVVLIE